jgi:hypothetical protein
MQVPQVTLLSRFWSCGFSTFSYSADAWKRMRQRCSGAGPGKMMVRILVHDLAQHGQGKQKNLRSISCDRDRPSSFPIRTLLFLKT